MGPLEAPPVRSPAEVIVEPPPLAKMTAVARLDDEFRKKGFDAGAAEVLSRAVVEPVDARRQLAYPTRVRVFGDITLHVINVDMWSHSVAPFPANPRESESRRLPIHDADSPDTGAPAPGPNLSCELTLDARSPSDFARSQQLSSSHLLHENPYVNSIREEGVLARLLVVAMRVRHRDGAGHLWTVTTPDGSSRIASAHNVLRIPSEDVSYRYNVNAREMRRVVGEWAAAARRAASESDLVPELRAATVPVMLVVGCQGGDVRQAVQAYAGMQHVSHPREWPEAGVEEARAEAVLVELVAVGVSQLEADWFIGAVGQQLAADDGISPLFDERAVLILSELRKHQHAANRGLRRVEGKDPRGSIATRSLAAVAADLALRPVRSKLVTRGGKQLDVARAQLASLYRELWSREWSASRRAPEELRDAAIEEVKSGGPGTAAHELALLAAYHVVSQRLVEPVYYHEYLERKSKGLPHERRDVHTVLLDMTRSIAGVRQLAQIVVDARAGNAPRRVSESGITLMASTGEPVRLTSDAVRYEIAPVDPVEDANAEPILAPGHQEPEHDLERSQRRVEVAASALAEDVRKIKQIRRRGDTRPLVEEVGWNAQLAGEAIDHLTGVSMELYRWKELAVRDRESAAAYDPGEDGGE